MFITTPSIIINSKPFSETSLIVRAYTKERGMKSFLAKGAKRSRSKLKVGLFQPLLLVELTWKENEKKELQVIREISLNNEFSYFHDNIVKSSLALFISEIISNTIIREEKNESLYYFFESTIKNLSICNKKLSTFHIIFLIEYLKMLGFSPLMNYQEDYYFDLLEAKFVKDKPSHNFYFDEKKSILFYKLFSCDGKELSLFFEERIMSLNLLLDYYSVHIPGFKKIKSHEIFFEIFN